MIPYLTLHLTDPSVMGYRGSVHSSSRLPCRFWEIGLLFLLPVLGFGAEEERPIPREIIGGKPTSVQSYPFVVRIEPQPDENKYCTGSLIAPKWVLTVAHCVIPMSTANLVNSAKVFHDYEGSRQMLYRDSKRIIPHPDFTYIRRTSDDKIIGLKNHGDIALIELASPFPDSSIEIIGISSLSAESGYAPSATTATLVGYGRMEQLQESPGMRFVEGKLYHAEDCRNRLEVLGEEGEVDEKVICVGSPNKRANHGDSGSPLIVKYTRNGNAHWLQIAIATKHAFGLTGTPIATLYLRVESYIPWIQKTTGNAALVIDFTSASPDDIEQLKIQLSKVKAQIQALQTTVRSLQSNKEMLIQRVGQMENLEGQDKRLQATEDGILNSTSATLAQ